MSIAKPDRLGESRIVLCLASILSFRMLGLFMIFPVFALYAHQYTHATPSLIGMALGIYGLTQAILQLPFSAISDRIGRRPIIMLGLILFAAGSVIAAMSHNIYLLILGRALQGAGAIGGTVIALAADLTCLENRTKTMAIIGATIGFSFAIAMVMGPIISNQFQLSGVFWLTALFALSGMAILYFLVPRTQKLISHQSGQHFWQNLKTVLQHRELTKLNISILILHAILSGSFVIIPLLFVTLQVPTAAQWQIYLPVLAGSFILTLLLLIVAEKKHQVKGIILLGIAAIALGEWLLFGQPNSKLGLLLALFIFFTGFNILEAILPSLISKLVPSQRKGSAMGIYSTAQFLGIFLGGSLAGVLRSHFASQAIFGACLLLCILWFIYMTTMTAPPMFKSKMLAINAPVSLERAQKMAENLARIPGVLDVDVSIEDCIAYLKVDNKIFNLGAFEQAKVMVS